MLQQNLTGQTERLLAFLLGLLLTLSCGFAASQDVIDGARTAATAAGDRQSAEEEVAAPKDNPEKPTPVTSISTSQTVVPDLFTGTASTSVSFDVPAGRAGLMPSLELTYRSSSTISAVGVGWSLQFSHIQRDATFGTSYTSPEPRFEFTRRSGTSDLTPVEGNAQVYRNKVETDFTRFRQIRGEGGTSWEALDRHGRRYVYGASEWGRTQSADGANVFRWELESIVDTHGNQISFEYTKDSGRPYVSRIRYARHVIDFAYESRPDPLVDYAAMFAVGTKLRLAKIIVTAQDRPYATYQLSYQTSTVSGRSLLSAVQRIGADGLSATLASFDYYQDPFVLGTPRRFLSRAIERDFIPSLRYRDGDYDGDGRADVSFIGEYREYKVGPVRVGRSPPDVNSSLPIWSRWNLGTLYPSNLIAGDVNADGKTDLVYSAHFNRPGDLFVMLGQPCADEACSFAYTHTPWLRNTGKNHAIVGNSFLADFTGDGRGDLLRIGKKGFNPNRDGRLDLFESAQDSFKARRIWSEGFGAAAGTRYRVADFNGDGRMDLVHVSGKGQLRMTLSSGDTATVTSTWAQVGNGAMRLYCFSDFNGDGFADATVLDLAGKAQVLLSRGDGFEAPMPWWDSRTKPDKSSVVHCPDLNGDGRADLAITRASGTRVSAAVSRGDVFTTVLSNYATKFASKNQIAGAIRFVDQDGNGTADLRISYNSGQVTALSSGGKVDLLRSMVNRFGGSAKLSYRPVSDFRNTQLNLPLALVSQIELDAGNGDVAKYSIEYEGGYYHYAQRELRGFRKAIVSGPADNSALSGIYTAVFHQGTGYSPDDDDPSSTLGVHVGKLARENHASADGMSSIQTDYFYRQVDDGLPVSIYSPLVELKTRECRAAACVDTRTAYRYDDAGNVLSEVTEIGSNAEFNRARSLVRTFQHNEAANLLGLLTSETLLDERDAAHRKASWCYNDDGDLTLAKRYRKLDAEVNCSRDASEDYIVNTLRYDSVGNVVAIEEPGRRGSQISYDLENVFPVQITDELGRTTHLRIHGVNHPAQGNGLYGQIAQITDIDGKTSTSTYDGLGRVARQMLPNGDTVRTEYEEDRLRQVSTMRIYLNDEPSSETHLDGFGRLRARAQLATRNRWIEQLFEYNEASLPKRISRPFFRGEAPRIWTEFSYDERHRLTRVANDEGRYEQCYGLQRMGTRDANGVLNVRVLDALGRQTELHQFETLQEACTTDTAGSVAVTRWSYDSADQPLTAQDAEGRLHRMEYDALGRMIRIFLAGGARYEQRFDSAGRLLERADGSDRKVLNEYDAVGRLTVRTLQTPGFFGPKRERHKVRYEGSRISQVVSGGRQLSFSHDDLGRVTTLSSRNGRSRQRLDVGYTAHGDLDFIRYPNGAVATYKYDGSMLSEVILGDVAVVKNTAFDALGNTTTREHSNGFVEERAFDGPGGAQSRYTLTNTAGRTLADRAYVYRGAALAQILEAGQQLQAFSYDGTGRIDVARAGEEVLDFEFDRAGTMTRHGRLGAMQYADASHPRAPTMVGNMRYTYDASGNRVTSQDASNRSELGYDPENRLRTASIEKRCGRRKQSIDMKLTYVGHPLWTDLTTTTRGISCDTVARSGTRSYLGGLYVAEGDRTEALIPLDGSISLTATTNDCHRGRRCDEVWRVHRDPIGNTALVTNASGEMFVQPMDPFGGGFSGARSAEGGVSRRGFAGQEFVAGLDMHLFPHRFYDQSIGQFISPDPVAVEISDLPSVGGYSYARNDPIGNSDRTGLYADDDGVGSSIRMPIPIPGIGFSIVITPIIPGPTPQRPSTSITASHASIVGTNLGGATLLAGDSRNHGRKSTSHTMTQTQAMDIMEQFWKDLSPGAKMLVGGVVGIAAGSVLLPAAAAGSAWAVLGTVLAFSGAVSNVGIGVGLMALPKEAEERAAKTAQLALDLAGDPVSLIGGTTALSLCGDQCLESVLSASSLINLTTDLGGIPDALRKQNLGEALVKTFESANKLVTVPEKVDLMIK